ncbi:MAG: hypothetical protein AAGE65_14645, partial [Planctomycetota bacterium]
MEATGVHKPVSGGAARESESAPVSGNGARGDGVPRASAAGPGLPGVPTGERIWGLPGWVVLVVLLAVAAVPMLAGLGRTPVNDVGEVRLLEVTRGTWARSVALGESGEGWTVDRFVPVVDGREALDEAPGRVWLTAAAWWPATWMGRGIDDLGTG